MNRMTKQTLLFLLGAMILVGWGSSQAQELYLNGFVEGLWTGGLDNRNPTDRDYPAAETRLQLRAESYGDNAEAFAKVDFIQDGFDSTSYDWELREAYVKFRLPIDIDFKIGRQILTWGTGDLMFINDVFAKDYQSFFIGRQDEYLKAPQTAARAEWYTGFGSFSVVAIPDFEPNILPTGDRLSFYNPMSGGIVGSSGFMTPIEPENSFDNTEIAFRYSRSIKGFNLSGYAYRGFYKDPLGVRISSPTDMQIYFPRLNVYGASLRGQVAGGILWIEGGYYDSREDDDGTDYFVENSSAKGMIGFERQVATDFTGNIQVYSEMMVDYDNYEKSHTEYTAMMQMMQPDTPITPKDDEVRTVITSRWTKQLASQTVTLSLFGFYSPSDEDAYIRVSTAYKYTDELSLMVGGNIFEGNSPHTMFGQFDHNDNLYVKINYGF
jgi:hypothetical protein